MSFQVMPDLSEAEYQALKDDIAKRGVMVPVEIDADTGDILDGYHRKRACDELGLTYPVIERHFTNDQERKEHALILNIMRRQLGPISWAQAFDELLANRGVERRPGRPSNGNAATVAALSEELGVAPRTARWRMALAKQLAGYPDLAAKVDSGEMAAKRAQRVVRERSAEQRREEPQPEVALPGAIDIRHCDFRELEIEPGTVDLIFTDPPYPAEYLPLWSELAQFAARALKPGALLVAYSGQFHLMEVLDRLREHLAYFWMGSLVLDGPHNLVHARNVWNKSKLLLFFANGQRVPSAWFEDTYFSESRQKESHDWQQSVGAARYYIEKLCPAGGLVVEPFLGSGTTAEAALDVGRSFIGCDVDALAVQTARKRIAERGG